MNLFITVMTAFYEIGKFVIGFIIDLFTKIFFG